MTHEKLRVAAKPDDIYQRVCQRWKNGSIRAISDDMQTRFFIFDPSGQIVTNLTRAWQRWQSEELWECDRHD